MGAKEREKKEWVRITEGRLYAYPVLRMMYKDVKAQSMYFYPLRAAGYEPTGIHGKGQTSNPTFNGAIKQEALEVKCDERLIKYLKETELIDNIRELCTMQEKEFLEMRYFKNYAMLTIIHELNVSKNLYYRVRESVLARSAVIFGYLEYDEYIKMLA